MKKAILEIKDEVNIRFKELSPSTRRKLSDAVKYFLPHAFHMPAYKLGRWDGCVRFCDVGGRSYINLLDRLLPIVAQDGYELEIEDHRHQWDLRMDHITTESMSHICWPAKHPAAGQPIIVRDYQVEAVNRFIDNPQCLQQIATGAGKTLITALLSMSVQKHGKSIVIVPNKDLVTQTAKDYRNVGLDVGVLYGDSKEYDKTHTICTWQSLASLEKDVKNGKRTEEFDTLLDGVVCVMVDEVHKAKADVLRDQLSGMFRNVPIRWGLTGTVPKDDHEATACVCALGPVIGQLTSKELQDMGVLAQLDIDVLQMQDGVLGFTGYAQELKWLTTDTTRLTAIGEMIEGFAQDGNTLMLVDRIATLDALKEMYPEWVFISGGTKQKDRQREYDDVSDSDNKVIVATYGVAAVGINIPRIFNLVMLEPGKSFVRVIQSIGRGIRKAEDKDYVRIIDITSNLKYSKRHLTKRKAFYREQQFPHRVTKVEYK